jgi:hypothetical protein
MFLLTTIYIIFPSIAVGNYLQAHLKIKMKVGKTVAKVNTKNVNKTFGAPIMYV